MQDLKRKAPPSPSGMGLRWSQLRAKTNANPMICRSARNVQALSPQDRQELLQIFPEALDGYILPKIRQIEPRIKFLEGLILAKTRHAQTMEDGWFALAFLKEFEIRELLELKDELARLRRYLPQPTKPKNTNRIDEDRIQAAKAESILRVIEDSGLTAKKVGASYRTLCPYHNEQTPSFYLYLTTNTFHCFGCQEHGDVIKLVQRLQGFTFVDAVRHLTPYAV